MDPTLSVTMDAASVAFVVGSAALAVIIWLVTRK